MTSLSEITITLSGMTWFNSTIQPKTKNHPRVVFFIFNRASRGTHSSQFLSRRMRYKAGTKRTFGAHVTAYYAYGWLRSSSRRSMMRRATRTIIRRIRIANSIPIIPGKKPIPNRPATNPLPFVV